jgi:hypothetical protein
MSVQELERRQRQRAASRANPQQSAPVRSPFEKVQTFAEWCAGKRISVATGKRLRAAGKIKVVQLSPGRIGVSESADREYMKACARDGA